MLLFASTRLLFLAGGFLVSFEEGLLDVGRDKLVAAVLWLPTEVEAAEARDLVERRLG
jgi:hypothetical protein